MQGILLDPKDVSRPTALDVALKNNPWAAAAIVLGILESDTPLDDKAVLLARSSEDYVKQVLAKLGSVKDPEDKKQARLAIRAIQEAWAPAAHLLLLLDKRHVMLKNSPGPGHFKNCEQEKLTVAGPMPDEGGKRIVCRANREIHELAKYDHYFQEDKHTYVIPTNDLDVRRRKSPLGWFSKSK
jgi:hypothetical protein